MKKMKKFFTVLLSAVLLFTTAVPVFAAATSSPPPAPTLSYSPMTPTNGNVTVTVYYPGSAVTKQYRLGANGTWNTYKSPFIITSNTHVYIQYQDKSGTWSTMGGFNISNIDKTPPDLPQFTASATAPTNQNVTVTISYSTDSTAKQFRVGNTGSWMSYAAPVEISANTTLYAQAADAAGNWTSVASYSITNIDKTPPSTPQLSADTLSPTNGNVNISVSYPADASIQQYRIGESGTWMSYSAPITIGENTAVYARAQDAAGNWSAENSLMIANIDKIAPESPVITASTTMATNQNVDVSVAFSQDSTVRQVKLGSAGIWADYTLPVTLEANDMVYARASDAAGNWTPEISFAVSNIDKTAPYSPVFTSSTTAVTNQPVSVDIRFSDDSVIRQFKIGDAGTWTNYTDAVILTANATVYAKAADAAGNWTPDASFTVGNIDTTAPDSPVFTASTTAVTSQPVLVTITYSFDSTVKQYRLGSDSNWVDYTAPFSVSSNNTVFARSSDAAGNWSQEASYTVSNIVSSKMVLGYTVKYYSTDMTSYNSIVNNTSALNEISTATYSVDGTGILTGTAPSDQISYANSKGIRPNLMVSNNFDPAIAKQLLESPVNRQNLKNNLLNLLKTNNYKGVDIDIENIPAADRSYLTALMSELYSALKPLGYGVSVAVPAKTYDSPAAAWNYAYDYKYLAMYADYLMLMSYDEHYPGGTPGAVASIGWVNNVVTYALTVVPKDKLVLGLAAYGYDWSSEATKSYSINGCINLAASNGATIYTDSATKSKYFTYTSSGIAHTVWFEDGDTIAYKLDLVNANDLKGIGIWRLGLENTSYWNMIKSKLNK